MFLYYYHYKIIITIIITSVDINDNEGSFQFSPEAEFTSPLYVHITPETDTEAESPIFTEL